MAVNKLNWMWNVFDRASIDEVDYMENQCVESPIRKGACDYSEYENQDIGYADLQIPAKTKDEVKWTKIFIFFKLTNTDFFK